MSGILPGAPGRGHREACRTSDRSPIIKRISTSTFVLASGGCTLLTLAACNRVTDVRGRRSWVAPFAVLGTNPLFIYVFVHLGGADLIASIVKPFPHGLFGWAGEPTAAIITSLVVLAGPWGPCYWLHRRRIYVRI